MLASPFLAVMLVGVQREAAVTRTLIPSQGVVTLVLTSAVILGAFVYVDVVGSCEPGAVD